MQNNYFYSEGIQDKLSPNVPLWHMYYFELKTINGQKTQEELLSSPFPAWEI